ncbi:MAG TPA: pentapeptide repeat-containing protein [Archangium sp.]|uniref:WD40 domain-containing protein n=1 Tax=Archangium sp. TaxID=1872627 RepID=UPI002E2F32F3|nr:pentapeptide repeat-containing protein [Archangium sp.]HEX5746118.1 pentapeptide repeat-containing protein [Archangium sp.]
MNGPGMDVLIVTALKDELDAVLDLEVEGAGREAWELKRDQYDFPFHVRELRNEHGETLRVAAAWSGEMGETSAATRAVRLIDELDPACLAMCGICAGRRKKVSLGDVIVADRVFSYDHGKLVEGPPASDGGGHFRDITTYNLEATWRMEATYFAQEFQKTWKPVLERPMTREAQTRWLLLALDAHEQQGAPSPDKHPERKTRCPGWASLIPELREKGLLDSTRGVLRLTEEGRARVAEERLLDPDNEAREPDFRVHVAPIATGKTVREDPKLFLELERHVRKVLGVEMEATAIQFVAEQLNRRAIIAKAVSDHADHDKDDAFRAFACHASAAFLMAFLRRYVRPREPGNRLARKEHPRRPASLNDEEPVVRKERRDDFLSRVERACALREPPGTQLDRMVGAPPFGTYLEVSGRDGKFPRIYPVAALDQPITREALETFIRGIHARYQYLYPSVISTLVHVGHAAPPELARLAESKRVNLLSFEEYQGLIDFTDYLRRQTAKLESDLIYPPAYYVEQRGHVSVGGQGAEATEDILQALRGVLSEPDRRFALVLGDFGTGKTFLLHELARRMGKEEGGALVPVLIELRALQKQRTLNELVAQHFAGADVLRFELEKFLYMLKEGRIALLFDGFDELALRVTYDRAMEHFGTLLEAAQGKAKIVVTSRTQHFLNDHQVKLELARKAEAIPGYRLIKLERFSEQQIRHFLVKRLGGEEAAHERMELLRDVRDLLGLSENPRLLSFIIELEAEKLKAARQGEKGEITSATLYALLIERWLHGEYVRVNPRGAPKGLSLEQLRRGATRLALLMWGRTERTVGMDELPEDLLAAAAQGGESLELEKVRHQLGSGSLLVRDEEGRFSFVHQSVMEWLVAEMAAGQVREGGEAPALGQREMSDLMADFFIALAGRGAARAWAEAKSASAEAGVIKRNALHVLGRLRLLGGNAAEGEAIKNLEGSDLRGQDLSGADLHQANLRKANLAGVTLVGANLSGARLEGASLARADLTRANLQGAILTGTDLSGANLVEADLRGAVLQGARMRAARLLGAKVDSLEGADVFGAALTSHGAPVPQLAPGSPISAVAFSPTDNLLATGHDDGMLRLWDVATGTVLRILEGHEESVTDLAFSGDGKLLASASRDWTAMLWSVEQGQSLQELEGHAAPVREVSFSPDGKLLASASEDRTVRLWSVEQGQLLRVLMHTGHVNGVAFSPDGTKLASASDDAKVVLWNPGEEVTVLRVFEDMAAPVSDVTFKSDGTALAAGSYDGTIRVWSLLEEREPLLLEGHRGPVLDVAFSPDGTLLASAAKDTTVALWSLTGDAAMHFLAEHDDAVVSVSFDRDGTLLASASEDGVVLISHLTDKKALHVLDGEDSAAALRVAFSPNGATLVCASDDDALSYWDVVHGRRVRVLEGYSESARAVTFNADGSRLAAVDTDRTVRVWSTAEVKLQRMFTGYTGEFYKVILSPDGATLASLADNGVISLWDVGNGRSRRLMERATQQSLRPADLAFSPDGRWFAVAALGSIKLWRLPGYQEMGTFDIQAHVRRIAFRADGEQLVAACDDKTLRFWSMGAKRSLGELRLTIAVRSMAFSPDGKLLACVLMDGNVWLHPLGGSSVARMLGGHPAAALSLAFSPDGATLAVACNDGVVCLHDVGTEALLARLLDLPDGWIALRADGRYRCEGETAPAFWYALGLCRFEPREVSALFPALSQFADDEPLRPRSSPA